MSELRYAIITKTDQVFVELSPERFRQIVKDCIEQGMTTDEAFDKCEQELKAMTFRK